MRLGKSLITKIINGLLAITIMFILMIIYSNILNNYRENEEQKITSLFKDYNIENYAYIDKWTIYGNHLNINGYINRNIVNATNIKDLKQKGEFATDKVVTLVGPKGRIENTRVLGPFRSYNQVEVSCSDAHVLGICPPVRKSGCLENSETITLIGEKGEITLENSCIMAENHIHMSNEDLKKYDVTNDSIVKVLVEGKREGMLFAHIKASENGVLEFHIDRDEANAFCLENESELTVLK